MPTDKDGKGGESKLVANVSLYTVLNWMFWKLHFRKMLKYHLHHSIGIINNKHSIQWCYVYICNVLSYWLGMRAIHDLLDLKTGMLPKMPESQSTTVSIVIPFTTVAIIISSSNQPFMLHSSSAVTVPLISWHWTWSDN